MGKGRTSSSPESQRTRGRALIQLRAQVFSMYGTECWLCRGEGADTIDHIIPVINGGGDDLDNLRPAHGRKSKNCVGNFSRKRPADLQQSTAINTINGITYGDGWIEKSVKGNTTRIFPAWCGLSLDDPFVQQFIGS